MGKKVTCIFSYICNMSLTEVKKFEFIEQLLPLNYIKLCSTKVRDCLVNSPHFINVIHYYFVFLVSIALFPLRNYTLCKPN